MRCQINLNCVFVVTNIIVQSTFLSVLANDGLKTVPASKQKEMDHGMEEEEL